MRMLKVAGAMLAVILISALLAGCSGGESTPSPSVKQQENPVAVTPVVNQPLNEETPAPTTPTPAPQVIQTLKLANPVFDKPSGTISYTIQAFDVRGAEVTGKTIPVIGTYSVTSDATRPPTELVKGQLPAELTLGVPITVPAGFSMTGVKSPMFVVNINWGAYQDFNTLKPLAYSQASLNQVAGFRLNQLFDKGDANLWFTIDALNIEGDLIGRSIDLQSLTLYVTAKTKDTAEVKELDRVSYVKAPDTSRAQVYTPGFLLKGNLNAYDSSSLVMHMIIQGEGVQNESSQPLILSSEFLKRWGY